MVDLPKRKIGIVACSGEELPEGTVTRLAALRVLEDLRPDDTVTICLPLFLAGGEGDRAFARFYPTISIDGCELRCAEKATEKYSNQPAASIMVKDLVEEHKLDHLEGKRHLNAAGVRAVEITAERIAKSVDELLGKTWDRRQGGPIKLETIDGMQVVKTPEPIEATCACQTGIPVEKMIIAAKEVSIVGFPLILRQFIEAGKSPKEENVVELMEAIKIYNPIPADEAAVYHNAVREAYTNYWFKEKGR